MKKETGKGMERTGRQLMSKTKNKKNKILENWIYNNEEQPNNRTFSHVYFSMVQYRRAMTTTWFLLFSLILRFVGSNRWWLNFHEFPLIFGCIFLKKNQMNTNGVAEAPSTSMLKAASFQDRNCWSNVMEGFHVREWTYTEGVVSNRASRQLVEKYFTLGKWHQFTSSTEKSSPNSFTRKIDDWKIGFPFGT